jgi:hypothetical protein
MIAIPFRIETREFLRGLRGPFNRKPRWCQQFVVRERASIDRAPLASVPTAIGRSFPVRAYGSPIPAANRRPLSA